jgi:hypothetical protein
LIFDHRDESYFALPALEHGRAARGSSIPNEGVPILQGAMPKTIYERGGIEVS